MSRTKKSVEVKSDFPLKKRTRATGKTVAGILMREWERSGMSSTSLAAKTGLTRSRIREITSGETPNPGLLTVSALLEGLGRDLAWLERQLKEVKRPKTRK